ncbi:unnamed protein product, partial [Chrysoparadoxa australica]
MLDKLVFEREEGRGLLTVSNHMSVLDDPCLMSCLIPFWRMLFNVHKLRWSICTDDVYFAVPRLVRFFRLGRALPISRRLGMEQPLFKDFFSKLDQGEW